ncbi:hypothetical protein ACOSP7_001299 [Xanthoceras sorbifolium]
MTTRVTRLTRGKRGFSWVLLVQVVVTLSSPTSVLTGDRLAAGLVWLPLLIEKQMLDWLAFVGFLFYLR